MDSTQWYASACLLMWFASFVVGSLSTLGMATCAHCLHLQKSIPIMDNTRLLQSAARSFKAVCISGHCRHANSVAASMNTSVGYTPSPAFVLHAGPRRNGEGTEDEEQGIIAADSTTTG